MNNEKLFKDIHAIYMHYLYASGCQEKKRYYRNSHSHDVISGLIELAYPHPNNANYKSVIDPQKACLMIRNEKERETQLKQKLNNLVGISEQYLY